MKTVDQKVLKFIDEKKLIASGDKLLIGLSGGPDSVFALIFLHKFSKRLNISLSAAHVNHNLRENAKADENFCRELCGSMDVEFHSISLDIKKLSKKSKLSVEETARNERYRFFEIISSGISADKTVTAHNKNDNLETVLLNLLKGTGIRGLTGIPAKRGKIIRPFLNLTKEEILEYLEKNKTGYRIDESNLTNDYQRNLIRNSIIPVIREGINPNPEEAVFRTSQNLAGYREFLDDFLAKTTRERISRENGEISIPFELIGDFGVFIISEIIIDIVSEQFGTKLNFENMKQVMSLFENQKGKRLELAGGLNVTREAGKIVIGKYDDVYSTGEITLKPGEKTKIGGMEIGIDKVETGEFGNSVTGESEIISADNTDNIFILRRWDKQDKFIPLGMKGFKKVSDFLTDAKVPARTKKDQMVMVNGGEIIWIPGYRIDDRFKISNNTKSFYKLWLKKI